MNAPDYFVPDRDPRAFYPLRHCLRAPPASVAEKYIDALTAPGDLILDPFAGAPTVARVAQKMGRRAIAVESNSLWSWLARAMATLPPAAEIDAALARLGDALKDDAPLRAHISQLYTTTCAACHQPTPADYFVHASDAGLVERHYTCAHCGVTRDDPAAEDDLARAQSFNARGLHYHLACERVAPEGALHAERIRSLLDLYTPRNLYALVTLTQKIDSLFRATRAHDILRLLLLHLLDRGASFYADVASDATLQLTPLQRFVEFNLWREIEIAAQELGRAAPALDLADAPADVVYAESPQAFVGRGSARALAENLPQRSVALILTAPPARRALAWTFSYFWGAWILGRAAVQTLIPFLDANRDAFWERRGYVDALGAAVNTLAKLLRDDARAVFVFDESWHGIIEALLLSAAGARLDLETLLFQPRLGDLPRREFDDVRGEYRIGFCVAREARAKPQDAASLEQQIRAAALAAAEDILARRGEPLAFSWVHHAAYARCARAGLLAQAQQLAAPTSPARLTHNAVLAGLTEGYARDFDHYKSRAQCVWLRRGEFAPPLIDRVDDAVYEILAHGVPIARAELEDALYRQFPGDLTPEAGLVELCAAAYADERDGQWHWRATDGDAQKTYALDVLARLGARLEYAVISDLPQPTIENRKPKIENFDLVWLADGDLARAFVWRARARFADLLRIHIMPACGYVVVPETLVAWLRAKVQRLPHLADAFYEAGWNFVRVPFAEKLLQAEQLTRHDLALMVGLAPAAGGEKAQLELF